ncbi:DUF6737 family protein [Synechococcus sp. M16CYN]|uniref:DUF6737 family protein n=1 Tax=Synechococcus sp. M16CYN TaxID=3103139 RepID=UPI0033411C82
MVISKLSAKQASQPASFWKLKPWWCQPWSIVLTGVIVIAGSWIVFHRFWISLPAAVAVGIWWCLFLILVPAAYQFNSLQDDPRL